MELFVKRCFESGYIVKICYKEKRIGENFEVVSTPKVQRVLNFETLMTELDKLSRELTCYIDKVIIQHEKIPYKHTKNIYMGEEGNYIKMTPQTRVVLHNEERKGWKKFLRWL